MSDEALLVRLKHLEELPSRIERLTFEIVELKLEFAKRRECGAPNLCLQLQPQLIELKETINEIETERQRWKGGAKVLNVLAITLGGVSGAFFSWLVNVLLKHAPKP